MNNYELSIVIPFYDEEETVEPLTNTLINEFNKNNINYELILVNNGSSDNTSKIVDKLSKTYKNVKTVHIKINQGYGWGILNGLKIANGEYVGHMDGDFEIQPLGLLNLYKRIKKTNADVGKGVRDKKESDILKYISSIGYDFLFFFLFFRFIKQVNANPIIIRKSCYKKMNLSSKDWFIDSEIIIKGLKNNYKIVNQVVSYIPRKTGKSHINFFDLFPIVIHYLKNTIKYRFEN
jgi:glycosyltransferase involved in cell wall biosynthesis